MVTFAESWRSVAWYVREVMGEADYDHYVAHLRAHHPEAPVPDRREFERAKMDRLECNPKTRCC